MDSYDELTHVIKQTAEQAMLGYRPHAFGHIAEWDPATHRVRCVVPSMAGDDGTPVVTGWMPLGVLSVGAGFGMQVAPFGGATVDNPTAGEQVMISIFDRQFGMCAVPCMFYTTAMLPPGPSVDPLEPGDVLIYNKSGTYFQLHTGTGDVEMQVQGQSTVRAMGNCTVQSTGGVVNVIASTVNVCRAIADTLYGLCTDIFRNLFNEHTHEILNVQTGSSVVYTQPPVQQADDTTTTSCLRSE